MSRRFAGTWHRNIHGDLVACMTEGGRACRRHSASEHIAAPTLEAAMALVDADSSDGVTMGLATASASPDASAPATGSGAGSHGVIHRVPADFDVADAGRDAFGSEPWGLDLRDRLNADAASTWDNLDALHRAAVVQYTRDMYNSTSDYLRSDASQRRALDSEMAMLSTMEGVAGEDADDVDPDDRTALEMVGFPDMGSYVRTLSESFASTSSPSMLLYRRRFIAADDGRSGEERACYAAAESGSMFVKTNFTSTSADPRSFESSVADDPTETVSADDATVYVVHVPEGTRGMYVEGVSTNPGEREFIIDRATRFRVVGIYERGRLDSFGHWDRPPIIALEAVPSEPEPASESAAVAADMATAA